MSVGKNKPDKPNMPDTPVPILSPRRRGLVAALLGVGALGGLGGAAWQWEQNRQATARAAEALALTEEDVCIVALPVPYDPSSGIPLNAAREVPTDARCPVCGMYPSRSRAWAAQVIFENGDAYFFDSPLSFFMYLGNVAHYTKGREPQHIVAKYVTDTNIGTGAGTGAWLDATTAVYVTGSSAKGPMRAGNLPAFASKAIAEKFVQQRGGQVLEFGAVDAALLQKLAPARRHDHSTSL